MTPLQRQQLSLFHGRILEGEAADKEQHRNNVNNSLTGLQMDMASN